MIPLKLHIRNFLSYREQAPVLDLTGVHTACLCGDNGHGKSALLDAITWCLWGKARGRVQDDLVSYGAEDCRVELEFLARGSRYRAVRSRTRAGGRRRQGAGDLQLQALSESDEVAPQVVSGNTIAETQGKIEQLVGMDYETFINSAFLLQGRADEFTNKTPAERKAVLGAILGLAAYDRYREKARLRQSETRAESDRLAGSAAQVQRELAELGDPAAELAAVGQELAALQERLAERRGQAEELREKVSGLESQAAALTERRRRLAQVEGDIEEIAASLPSGERRLQEYRRLLAQAAEIAAGVAELAQARQRFEELEDTRRRAGEWQQERQSLVQAISVEQARREAESEQLRRRIERELMPKAAAESELTAALAAARQSLEGLAAGEREIAAGRSRMQALADGIGERRATMERYATEGKQLGEKLRLLENTDPAAAVCPLCQSPLGEDGCQRLAAAYQGEIGEKRELYRESNRQLKGLEGELAGLEKELPRQEQRLVKQGNEIRARMAQLEQQIAEARQAGAELGRVQEQLTAAMAAVAAGDFAQEERQRLATVEAAITALAYNDDAYQQSYRRIQELQPYVQREVELQQAVEREPAEAAALQQAQGMLERRREEAEEHREQLRRGEAAMEQLPAAQARWQEAAAEIAELEGRQQSALGRQGLLEGQQQRRESLMAAAARNQEQLAVAREEQGIYQELVNAFGKQGIQAMLIETVVPRLEGEANILLGRMTDNRMHVKLETQRERRSGPSGEPVETLEIKVSDELGLRSYELYSGGEAFRVNLALRIALSKVLSQRTGAPLPTLFIDEGFGTQDASGRERILDVISAIEPDFDKIIVITHLDDLKDMFPARIEVQKDGNGSTFWLS